MTTNCPLCEPLQIESRRLEDEVEALRAELAEVKKERGEIAKLCALQAADLERLKAEAKEQPLPPNRPEHVRADELQLVFEHVIKEYGAVAQNDTSAATSSEPDGATEASTAPAVDASASTAGNAEPSAGGGGGEPKSKPTSKPKPKRGGRRNLDTANLPVETVTITPEEVLANPELYRRVGVESSDRLAFRKALYLVLRIERGKYIALDAEPNADATVELAGQRDDDDPAPGASDDASPKSPRIVCAELPGSVWPRVMADVSSVTQIILSKYDMCLPLHRQERASPRCGYHLPRSTQCDWVEAAYSLLYRVVDAMFEDSLNAHCLATDATTAPIRSAGESVPWHVFVFIADASHVVFRPARHHNGDTIRAFLGRYRGYLLADAAPIYDSLYEAGLIVEVSCWAHLRRYFFKARVTEPALALEALAIIGKIFEVGRDTDSIPMPERTTARARQVQPYLELFDRWIAANREGVEARSKLAAAFTYYDNQYDTLRTFLRDGELRLDNNISEQQLRHLVVGLHNWNVFETSAGLDWYCVFRSLIASCTLHGIEAQDYLDEVLRLAPHWPITEMLALSPREWPRTRASLTTEQQAIISPPWVHFGSTVTPQRQPVHAA